MQNWQTLFLNVSYPCVFLSHLETLGYFMLCGSLSVPTMMSRSAVVQHILLSLWDRLFGIPWQARVFDSNGIALPWVGSSQQQWSAALIYYVPTLITVCIYVSIEYHWYMTRSIFFWYWFWFWGSYSGSNQIFREISRWYVYYIYNITHRIHVC